MVSVKCCVTAKKELCNMSDRVTSSTDAEYEFLYECHKRGITQYDNFYAEESFALDLHCWNIKETTTDNIIGAVYPDGNVFIY